MVSALDELLSEVGAQEHELSAFVPAHDQEMSASTLPEAYPFYDDSINMWAYRMTEAEYMDLDKKQ